MDGLSAIPQQPQLGRLAQFLRYLETQSPEFLPKQLDVMGLVRQLALPQSSTVENLSYGNLPFTMPPQGTGALIPQVKTGRKPEVADLIGMLGGVPGVGAVSDVAGKLSNEAADAIVKAITRNPQATATGVIRETSMPFMQAVAPRTPGLLETPAKSELGFYSALEQATTPLQNKGTGAQFLAQIEKTAGVKPEEIKWTGLDEFLRNRETVTKAEVQDYLAANRVNLQEVRLGEGLPAGYTIKQNPTTRVFEVFDENGRIAASGLNRSEAIQEFAVTHTSSNDIANTKFSSYTLPGGENYREILLTLPEKKLSLDEFLESAGKKYGDNTPRNQWSAEDNATYEKLLKEDSSMPRGYRSSHFDQPNILAHMRVNDRVVDGKKTLFIEEIQSDWHQAGRKKGYDTPEARAAEKQKLDNILAERQTLLGEQRKLEELALPYTNQGKDAPSEIVDQWSIVSNRLNNLQTEQNRLGQGFGQQVPDAPFKTSWHELSLKRAIQEASEKGYDQIAFTTGKTQAERYDLSKQVNKIDVEAVDEVPNLYFVDVDVVGRGKMNLEVENGIVRSGEFEGKPLEDVVGKEIAEKVFAVPQNSFATLKGDDLRIGGEGMKGFYDNILPKSLEKLGKKFDAKVGKTEMDGIEVWQMDITPKMRESVLTKGQPLFATTPVAAGLLDDQNE